MDVELLHLNAWLWVTAICSTSHNVIPSLGSFETMSAHRHHNVLKIPESLKLSWWGSMLTQNFTLLAPIQPLHPLTPPSSTCLPNYSWMTLWTETFELNFPWATYWNLSCEWYWNPTTYNFSLLHFLLLFSQVPDQFRNWIPRRR